MLTSNIFSVYFFPTFIDSKHNSPSHIIPQYIFKDVEEDVDVSGLKDERGSKSDAEISAATDLNSPIPQLPDKLVSRRSGRTVEGNECTLDTKTIIFLRV